MSLILFPDLLSQISLWTKEDNSAGEKNDNYKMVVHASTS